MKISFKVNQGFEHILVSYTFLGYRSNRIVDTFQNLQQIELDLCNYLISFNSGRPKKNRKYRNLLLKSDIDFGDILWIKQK